MAELFQYKEKNTNLFCYSERGLMSFFMVNKIPLTNGMCLINSIKKNNNQIAWNNIEDIGAFSEFDLGNRGFGKPDGGLLFRINDTFYFIFIEAKLNESYQKSIKNKQYNSSIVGQIELKYRFIFALKTSVSEDFIQESQEFKDHYTNDVYAHNLPRHLYIKDGVEEIIKIINKCEIGNIYYLIITNENINPLINCTHQLPDFYKNEQLAKNLLWIPKIDLL
jgi:hypothetical protein